MAASSFFGKLRAPWAAWRRPYATPAAPQFLPVDVTREWTPQSRRVGALGMKCGMTMEWTPWGERLRRMLPHWRALDTPGLCERHGLLLTREWLLAPAARPSVVQSSAGAEARADAKLVGSTAAVDLAHDERVDRVRPDRP